MKELKKGDEGTKEGRKDRTEQRALGSGCNRAALGTYWKEGRKEGLLEWMKAGRRRKGGRSGREGKKVKEGRRERRAKKGKGKGQGWNIGGRGRPVKPIKYLYPCVCARTHTHTHKHLSNYIHIYTYIIYIYIYIYSLVQGLEDNPAAMPIQPFVRDFPVCIYL